jgi:hypothetical protein
LYLNAKYLIGVKINGNKSSINCGLSKELLYSSVNILDAAIIECTPVSADFAEGLETNILIDPLKLG